MAHAPDRYWNKSGWRQDLRTSSCASWSCAPLAACRLPHAACRMPGRPFAPVMITSISIRHLTVFSSTLSTFHGSRQNRGRSSRQSLILWGSVERGY
jgi:hypothetical protein